MKLFPFIFPYKRYVVIDEDTRGEITYYYPMLPCIFEWKGIKTSPTEGLLDSGADSIVLPRRVASFLNLEMNDTTPMRVVGRTVERYKATANLTIGRAGRFVSFPNVEVSIPKEGETPILFGRKPIFDKYKITFIDPEKRFIMEPYE